MPRGDAPHGHILLIAATLGAVDPARQALQQAGFTTEAVAPSALMRGDVPEPAPDLVLLHASVDSATSTAVSEALRGMYTPAPVVARLGESPGNVADGVLTMPADPAQWHALLAPLMTLAARHRATAERVHQLEAMLADPADGWLVLDAHQCVQSSSAAARALMGDDIDGQRFELSPPPGSTLRFARNDPQRGLLSLEARCVDGDVQDSGARRVWLRDVTDQARHEKLNAGRAAALEDIARGAPLESVLERVVSLVESQYPQWMCSILRVGEDDQRLYPLVAPRIPDAYAAAISGARIGPKIGSCGTAAHLGHAVIVRDIASDPLWEGIREKALAHGLRACWSVPILATDGHVLGTFATYAAAPAAPDAEALEMVTSCAHLASVAMERECERRALRRSQQLLETAQRVAHQGHWKRDCASGRLTWSPEVYRLFGVDAHTFEPRLQAFLEMVDPRDRTRLSGKLEAPAHGPIELEYRIRRGDGSTRVMLERSEIEFDAQGQPVAEVGVVMDVTHSRRAQKALRSSEQRYRSLFLHHPDAVYSLDPDGNYLSVNRAFTAMTGITETQALETSFRPLVPPEWRDHAERMHRRALTGEALHFDLECINIRRERLSLEVTNLPIVVDGQITGIFGIARDVTPRRRIEQRLRDSEARMRHASRMALLGSWDLDVEEACFAWSEEACAIHDLPEHSRTSLAEALSMCTEEHRERVAACFRCCLDDGEPFEELFEIITPAGRRRWIRTIGEAIRNAEGRTLTVRGVIQDVTERKRAEREIHDLASYDPLTDLPNRSLLLSRLDQALAGSGDGPASGALLFIDMDNFKALNDTLGHDRGDQLLRQVADRLRGCVGTSATVARLGGDEFVVLLERLGHDEAEAGRQARAVGEQLLGALDSPYTLDGSAHHGSASIGIALFGAGADSSGELLKRADLAMYQAKASGRNTLCFFDPSMEAALNERATLEAQLREAVRHRQFCVHFQPQVDRLGQPRHAEVLLRWQHPGRGLVYPTEFIALAEETGLIVELGTWVLEQACRQLRAWQADPVLGRIGLSVNVSARQFRHPEFAAQVMTTLERTGAEPSRLQLELTESLLLNDVGAVVEKMSRLKALGVGFSLDDFGTGYSSLAYLKRLPFDTLKIDQSFVKDVLSDANDDAIARTIVALGQSLGLGVVAEGVENEAQRTRLAHYGCDAYQGYLFSHPLAIDAFEDYMRRHVPAPGGRD